MKGISKAIFTGKIKGVLLDAEYYTENPLDNPWTYTTEQYPHHSFEEVQDQVRKRGTQFIKALQQYTSNFSILSIWISSLIMDDEKVMPYQKTRHALLPHFIEGVLLGKTKGVQVIDGNELAYWNMKPSQFIESPDLIQKTTVRLMKPAKGRALAKTIQVSQPVFYDGLMVLHPRFNLGSESNLRWNWLEENIKHAVATSTSNVVWFYNERVDWWNGTINDTLVNILEHCKDGFTKVAQAKPTALKISKYHNVNAGKGHFYSTDNKKPMQAGEPAFLYTWNNKSKQLKLTYPEKIPAGVTVFVNGVLSATIKPMAASDTVKLKTFTKGVIAVLAKYNDGKEASGFLSN
ncbi:MAG: hypothetical protein IPP72_19445 [Chitinophagaceae bacterium]|nr:hypothetical protein [Chitinophagaceae bacterium]